MAHKVKFTHRVQSGKFREAFWTEDIIKDKLFFVKVEGLKWRERGLLHLK